MNKHVDSEQFASALIASSNWNLKDENEIHNAFEVYLKAKDVADNHNAKLQKAKSKKNKKDVKNSLEQLKNIRF